MTQMQYEYNRLKRWFLVALVLAWSVVGPAMAGDTNSLPGAKVGTLPPEVELRGRVVCLAEEMHRLYGTDLESKHEHIYGFKTDDGVYYTLLRTDLSEALFVDVRLREKELLLKGHVLPKSHVFDVTNMKSVRNGVVCDLYYYCDVCAIKTISPGPCMCCQGPVRLVEKPVQ